MARKLPNTDPEEIKAEKHVAEIMGEAHDAGGSATEQPRPTDHTDDAARPDSGQPPLGDQAAEADLDMAKLPEDFKTTASTADDPQTTAAVDDILRHEAENALPDAEAEADDSPSAAVVMKPSFFERVKNGFYHWWTNPWKRYGTIAALLLLCVVVFVVPKTRAMVFNAIGVRTSVMVTVYDGASKLPLKNAQLHVDGRVAKTDEKGEAKVTGVRLGTQQVTVSKPAFASSKKTVQLGMRITDIGEVTLKPVGVQLTYQLSDYLSGKPLVDVELSSGEATAKSDKKGKAVITLAPSEVGDTTIRFAKKGFRDEKVAVTALSSATTEQKMVPQARAIYISKESGKYDVYKVYIDGKSREVLYPGTGLELQTITTLPAPSGEHVAVASTRDEKRNKDGYLLTALNVVDVESGSAVNLDYAEQITLLGWRGDVLLYQQIVAGASAANPARQKLIAYDVGANKRLQLAAANYFTNVQLIGNTLYYGVSSTDPNAKDAFARIDVDGTAKKSLYSGDVWSVMRTEYTKLKLQTPDKWYEYTLGATSPAVSTPADEYRFRTYLDSPDVKQAVWVDVRDSRGVLMRHNVADHTEKELVTQRNMQAPLYWLGENTVVFRVAGASEVADYVVSTDGGAVKKIADVSLTGMR
jgi:hypothetical protein